MARSSLIKLRGQVVVVQGHQGPLLSHHRLDIVSEDKLELVPGRVRQLLGQPVEVGHMPRFLLCDLGRIAKLLPRQDQDSGGGEEL